MMKFVGRIILAFVALVLAAFCFYAIYKTGFDVLLLVFGLVALAFVWFVVRRAFSGQPQRHIPSHHGRQGNARGAASKNGGASKRRDGGNGGGWSIK